VGSTTTAGDTVPAPAESRIEAAVTDDGLLASAAASLRRRRPSAADLDALFALQAGVLEP
jgi:hypothetical protein